MHTIHCLTQLFLSTGSVEYILCYRGHEMTDLQYNFMNVILDDYLYFTTTFGIEDSKEGIST